MNSRGTMTRCLTSTALALVFVAGDAWGHFLREKYSYWWHGTPHAVQYQVGAWRELQSEGYRCITWDGGSICSQASEVSKIADLAIQALNARAASENSRLRKEYCKGKAPSCKAPAFVLGTRIGHYNSTQRNLEVRDLLMRWMRCNSYRYLYAGPRWDVNETRRPDFSKRLQQVGRDHPEECGGGRIYKASGKTALAVGDINGDKWGNEIDAMLLIRWQLGVRGDELMQGLVNDGKATRMEKDLKATLKELNLQ